MKCYESLLKKNDSSNQLAAQTGSKAHSLQKPLFSAHISAHVKLSHNKHTTTLQLERTQSQLLADDELRVLHQLSSLKDLSIRVS